MSIRCLLAAIKIRSIVQKINNSTGKPLREVPTQIESDKNDNSIQVRARFTFNSLRENLSPSNTDSSSAAAHTPSPAWAEEEAHTHCPASSAADHHTSAAQSHPHTHRDHSSSWADASDVCPYDSHDVRDGGDGVPRASYHPRDHGGDDVCLHCCVCGASCARTEGVCRGDGPARRR